MENSRDLPSLRPFRPAILRLHSADSRSVPARSHEAVEGTGTGRRRRPDRLPDDPTKGGISSNRARRGTTPGSYGIARLELEKPPLVVGRVHGRRLARTAGRSLPEGVKSGK